MYTLETAKNAHKHIKLREWVIAFLQNDGGNEKLAKIILDTPSSQLIFTEFPLNMIHRVMGAKEENLEFSESKDVWDKRINSFVNDIRSGYESCPLIATDFWGETHLSDGSHRHEALIRAGFKKYWVIFFVSNDLRAEEVRKKALKIL